MGGEGSFGECIDRHGDAVRDDDNELDGGTSSVATPSCGLWWCSIFEATSPLRRGGGAWMSCTTSCASLEETEVASSSVPESPASEPDGGVEPAERGGGRRGGGRGGDVFR